MGGILEEEAEAAEAAGVGVRAYIVYMKRKIGLSEHKVYSLKYGSIRVRHARTFVFTRSIDRETGSNESEETGV